jgi:hypothetical protein
MRAVDGAVRRSASRRRPQDSGVVTFLVAMVAIAGCSTSPPAPPDAPDRALVDAGGVPIPAPHSGPPRLLSTSELSDAEKRFGISAERTANLTYQPEVVLLRAGVNAIRALSDDGLVWTLDPNAEGIDDIQPGKVLLLSTRASGRVLAVTRTNAGVDVVLGPAEMTEIIRDGSFALDQPVDLSQALPMALPQSFDPVREVDPIAANRGPGVHGYSIIPARLAPAAEHGFNVFPLASIQGVGAELRSKPGGVLLVAQVRLRLEQPQLNFHLAIKPGGIESALVELKGAAGVEVAFEAAASGPNARNVSADRAAPVDLSIPINGLGIPFALHVRQVFRVQTAFASTGAVKARGYYALTGGMRAEYSGGKFNLSGPKGFETKEVLLPSLDGAVFGPTGLVLVHQVNVMIGVGVAGFVAGPYVYENNGFTITQGSALSRPLIPECRRETVNMAVGAGVGYRMPPAVVAFINDILSVFRITARIKDAGGIETKPAMLASTGWYWPKTQYCGS